MRPLLCLALVACSLEVDYTGTYFPCGENELCPDDFVCKQGVCIPTEPDPPSCTSAVATGDQHTCIVRDTDGSVWCWGRNNEGQLGNDTVIDSTIAVQVADIVGASQVVTGEDHTCAIVGGSLRCWGANDEGQLGDGSQIGARTPVEVPGLTGVTAVAAGSLHTCAIAAAGEVHCWGINSSGELGDGTTTPRRSPGRVNGVTATAIAASDDSTCVVDAGTLKCWGFNGEGLFMNGGMSDAVLTPTESTILTEPIAGVAIGGAHLCVFTEPGEVFCAGGNDSGQLGGGTTNEVANPLPVQAFIPAKVVKLSLGGNHSCAVDEAGGSWCWGDDESKLALGVSVDFAAVPVRTTFEAADVIAAGGDHTCVRLRTGAIACAGANETGQLGIGDRTTQPTAQVVPGLTGIAAITTGGDYTCALEIGGGVQCWGEGSEGELGDGTFQNRPVPGPAILTGVTKLVSGGDHVCAITMADEVQCWGRGTNGQLGDGVTASRGSPLPVRDGINPLRGVTQLSLGDNHTCALVGSVVKCWGRNQAGQLGAGVDPVLVPTDVVGIVGTVTQIAAGGSHTCVLDDLSEVQCFGANADGQLGDDTVVGNATPVKVIDEATGLPLTGVVEIFARGNSTFARVGGTIFAWGNGCASHLGVQSPGFCENPTAVPVANINNAAKLAIGYTASCALKDDDTLACWGENYFGQFGNGTFSGGLAVPIPGLVDVSDISASGEHMCAVKGDGTVACWGGAHRGQLGDGVTEDRGPNFVRFSCTD